MSKPNYYIFHGGPELIKDWHEPEKWTKHKWYWSANKHVRPGDKALIYLTAPLSRIVGVVEVLGEPFFNGQPYAFDNPHMHERRCVEVGNPIYFGDRCDLSMKKMRELFSVDWGWVRYPRGNTRVPEEILPAILEIIEEAGRPKVQCRQRNCVDGFIVHNDWKASRTVCPECGGH